MIQSLLFYSNTIFPIALFSGFLCNDRNWSLVSIWHVKQSANMAAHILAKMVISQLLDCAWLGVCPPFIQSFVMANQASSLWFNVNSYSYSKKKISELKLVLDFAVHINSKRRANIDSWTTMITLSTIQEAKWRHH
jgi:hypothetical protein